VVEPGLLSVRGSIARLARAAEVHSLKVRPDGLEPPTICFKVKRVPYYSVNLTRLVRVSGHAGQRSGLMADSIPAA